jgi:hypothetical protein
MNKIKGVIEKIAYIEDAKNILLLIGTEKGQFRAQISLQDFLQAFNATLGNRNDEDIKREIDKLLEICEYRKKYIYRGKEVECISDPSGEDNFKFM